MKKNDWFTRLSKAIRDDGRDMKAISKAAKCGQNYVQQMLKDGKEPGIDRFIRILATLGRPASLHIILGAELTAQDEELIRLISGLSDKQKQTALEFFRSLRAS